MIKIISCTKNEEGKIEVVFRLNPSEAVYKNPKHKMVPIIQENVDVKLGELIVDTEVCNKSGFPNEYTFIFEQFVRKPKKKVDTEEPSVKIRRSRKTEVTGG